MHEVTLRNGRTFSADEHVSILDAARGHDVVLEYSCRTGRCGVCKAAVLAGETVRLREEESLSEAERDAGLILTCCRAAMSSLSLDIEDLGRLKGYMARTLPCRITAIERLAPDVVGVSLRLPPASPLRFLPGQYVDIITKGVRRSYSLANSPRADNLLELHIRELPGGMLSAFWFGEAKEGDLLRMEAPLGTFFLREGGSGPLIFLATGTGIAPVKAILEELAAEPGLAEGRPVHVYWGNRHRRDFYWQPTSGMPGVSFVPVLSGPDQDWSGRRGYVQSALLDDIADLSQAQVYACGSQIMIKDAEALLVQRGLPRKSFFSDAFVSSS
jgi:CDP-4-dehydro-6-deoxyglucose reductase